MSDTTDVRTISHDELREKIDRGAKFTLVETLSQMSYYGGHLPGAINLPPDQVTKRAAEVLPDKSAEIVVYCARPTWHASEHAARELAALGYTDVREYVEGKQGWTDAGLPIVTGSEWVPLRH